VDSLPPVREADNVETPTKILRSMRETDWMSKPSTGRKSPHYGKLNTVSLPGAVKAIWYSRDDEPPPCEPHGWSWEQTAGLDIETPDLIRKILDATPLTERETQAIWLHVVEGETLDEVGQVMDCTRERVRQIVNKGLRRLRTHQEKVTGIRPDELWCEVTTWRGWLWVNRSIRR
jgi:RNA polymerase sigma factor (sigma-70 family)